MTDRTSTAYIAINPLDGNVWVGVPFENLFWIFSPDGEYLESWGKAGTGDGEFDFSDHAQNPDGFTPIAFAPDGSFYVGDTGNSRVQMFDADRNYVGQWGSFGSSDGHFVQIVSIATDGTAVYVGDGERYDIQAFDAQGSYLRAFGADGGFALVAVDGDGRVHATNPGHGVASANGMAIFDADGTEITFTQLGRIGVEATQLTVDAAGNSYVPLEFDHYPWTEQGIVQLDPSGSVEAVWEGGGDFLDVAPDGGTLYATRGIQLDTQQWTFVRKYALPVS